MDVPHKCALMSNIVFWSVSSICLLLDRVILSEKSLQEYKVQGLKAVLTTTEARDIFKVALLNMGPVTLFYLEMERAFLDALDFSHKPEEEEWMASRELLCVVGFLVILEIWFYVTHRLLHIPYLYKTIHKVHHRFQQPCAMAAVYAHPLEFMFGNVAGLALGPILTQAHPYTSYAWFAVGLFSTCLSHSGYKPFAKGHDAHHEFYHYNYGVGGFILDGLFGTRLAKEKEH